MSGNELNWQEVRDRRYLEMARDISLVSLDPSTKVGAVVVSRETQVFKGVNRFPPGVFNTDERWKNREEKYKYVVHAEIMALLLAGRRANWGTIYVYPSFGIPPLCAECAKAVIVSGIQTVVGYEPDAASLEKAVRWGDSLALAKELCYEAGIKVRSYVEKGGPVYA